MGLIGNDISYWQVFKDYKRLADTSDFLFIRLQKGYSLDRRFEVHWENTKSMDFRSPYLFLSPYVSSEKQVEQFYENVQRYCPNYTLPPVIDVESKLLSGGRVSAAFEKGKELFGEYPIAYSSAYFWSNSYPKLNNIKWVANYPNSLQHVHNFPYLEDQVEATMRQGFPNIPSTWNNWTFWQFTKSGIGSEWGTDPYESKQIDVNYFRGNYYDLKTMFALWKKDQAPPPPEPPQPGEEVTPIKEVMTTVNLNIRASNSTTSKDIGTLRTSSQVPVVEEKDGWYRIDGWISKQYTNDV